MVARCAPAALDGGVPPTPADFERMWSDLAPVGRSASSGGYFRQPFTPAERELSDWFREQAAARSLRLESDATGNLVAWWDPDAAVVREQTAPDSRLQRPLNHGLSRAGVLTGSHLDSVLDGGAYDGPLGVVSALAAIDELRDRGFVPGRPLGVSVFVEEEGSRFGLACLGSRLATGATPWDQARVLRDRDGVAFEDVAEGGGPGLLDGVGVFVELHVEQGRDLVDRSAAIGVASEIWPHGRYRFDFRGEANHAGTTRMEDRVDPMLTYAMTALAANKQARVAEQRATFGRVEVTPNGTNAVPSQVLAWLDARCSSDAALAELVDTITRQATERAERDRTSLTVTPESVSGAVTFDLDLARRIAADHKDGDWPVIPTAAGHDAGILSAAGIPTAMVFVRNPTGVSHSPAETAAMPDCLAGVRALADTLERLAT
jgi:beta-ureidopropionase / N-carbamoyl-L-amino-acid hydrolase